MLVSHPSDVLLTRTNSGSTLREALTELTGEPAEALAARQALIADVYGVDDLLAAGKAESEDLAQRAAAVRNGMAALFGALVGGTPARTDEGPAAQALRARLDALAARYAGRAPVRVFVQAGLDPIYTLNHASIVSDALRLCGGVNVFGDAPVVAPQVGLESVPAARRRPAASGAPVTDRCAVRPAPGGCAPGSDAADRR